MTLPCPDGARGRCGCAGRRCLPRWGKDASIGRAPVLAFWSVSSRRRFLRARFPDSARAGMAAEAAFLPFPRCFPFRRGYGGLCPHPLKGLVP